jgi:hypothetical protein
VATLASIEVGDVREALAAVAGVAALGGDGTVAVHLSPGRVELAAAGAAALASAAVDADVEERTSFVTDAAPWREAVGGAADAIELRRSGAGAVVLHAGRRRAAAEVVEEPAPDYDWMWPAERPELDARVNAGALREACDGWRPSGRIELRYDGEALVLASGGDERAVPLLKRPRRRRPLEAAVDAAAFLLLLPGHAGETALGVRDERPLTITSESPLTAVLVAPRTTRPAAPEAARAPADGSAAAARRRRQEEERRRREAEERERRKREQERNRAREAAIAALERAQSHVEAAAERLERAEVDLSLAEAAKALERAIERLRGT